MMANCRMADCRVRHRVARQALSPSWTEAATTSPSTTLLLNPWETSTLSWDRWLDWLNARGSATTTATDWTNWQEWSSSWLEWNRSWADWSWNEWHTREEWLDWYNSGGAQAATAGRTAGIVIGVLVMMIFVIIVPTVCICKDKHRRHRARARHTNNRNIQYGENGQEVADNMAAGSYSGRPDNVEHRAAGGNPLLRPNYTGTSHMNVTSATDGTSPYPPALETLAPPPYAEAIDSDIYMRPEDMEMAGAGSIRMKNTTYPDEELPPYDPSMEYSTDTSQSAIIVGDTAAYNHRIPSETPQPRAFNYAPSVVPNNYYPEYQPAMRDYGHQQNTPVSDRPPPSYDTPTHTSANPPASDDLTPRSSQGGSVVPVHGRTAIPETPDNVAENRVYNVPLGVLPIEQPPEQDTTNIDESWV